MLRDGVSPGSRAGLHAWIVSCLFHALLLALFIPLFQHLPRIMPEPFHLTISLVESFNAPSEGLSTPLNGVNHPMVARTSEGQPFVPPPPSATASRESESVPQLMAVVQEQASPLTEIAEPTIPSGSHAVAIPQPSATAMLNRHFLPAPAQAVQSQPAPLEKSAQNLEPPAAFAEPARSQENATEQSMPQAIEPSLNPSSRSSDQPIGTGLVPSFTPSDVEAPAASPTLANDAMSVATASVPVTRNESESPPLMASRLPAIDHGSSLPAVDRPTRKDEARSGQAFPKSPAQARPVANYGWLQQALSHRLEELKRSVRPSIEESGRLRVLVKAVVSSTGELMEAEIVSSSGHHRIDQEAMTLVQQAFPMSLDRDLDRPSIAMRIPITFLRD